MNSLAICLATLASPALASIVPTAQDRSIYARYAGSYGGQSVNEEVTIAAGDFGPFDESHLFTFWTGWVAVRQNSGVNPGGHTGIYASGSAESAGTQDDLSGFNGTTSSDFALTFTLNEPLMLTGTISAECNGGGMGQAEMDAFLTLARHGGDSQTWRIEEIGGTYSNTQFIETELSPGTYTLSAGASSRVGPFNNFSPLIAETSFDFQIGVPAPSSLALLAVLAAPRRRTSRYSV